MQAWDSSNPTVTTPISGSELAAVNSILPSLSPARRCRAGSGPRPG